MGINTRGTSGSNNTYLNIFQNNIVLEYNDRESLEKKIEALGLDEDKIKVRQRVKGKNEGKDVFYYILFDISGILTNIRLHENDYGEFLEIELTDVDEKFSISLGDVSSRMSKDFARRLGNIDTSEEMVFGVWDISAEKADNGKAKSGVRMYQNDTKLEYCVTYDEMPEPLQKKKGNKTIWDFSEQENYLYDVIVDFKEENFKSDDKVDKKPSKPVSKPKSRVKAVKETAQDDMPF